MKSLKFPVSFSQLMIFETLFALVPGNWTDWSNWTDCSANVTRNGTWYQYRFRDCSNPPPLNGGFCPGNNQTFMEEDFIFCPPGEFQVPISISKEHY